MIATGRLRHAFHGTYHATVILAFTTPADAAAALAMIQPSGVEWTIAASEPRALVGSFNAETLAAFKAAWAHAIAIEPCGWRHCRTKCKRAEIDSLAHSVDVGPVFKFDTDAVKVVKRPRAKRVAKVIPATSAEIVRSAEPCPYCSETLLFKCRRGGSFSRS